jgi:hypothetical protein
MELVNTLYACSCTKLQMQAEALTRKDRQWKLMAASFKIKRDLINGLWN